MKIFGLPIWCVLLGAALGYVVAKRTEIRIPVLAP